MNVALSRAKLSLDIVMHPYLPKNVKDLSSIKMRQQNPQRLRVRPPV